MLSHPILLLIEFAVAGLVVVGVLLAWRDRGVDFLHRAVLGDRSDAVVALTLDRVLPVLVDDGYRMVANAGHTTILERRFFPVWTVLAAIFLFPVGLLALLARGRETIVIAGRDGVVELHGRCGKVTADFVVDAARDAAADLTAV